MQKYLITMLLIIGASLNAMDEKENSYGSMKLALPKMILLDHILIISKAAIYDLENHLDSITATDDKDETHIAKDAFDVVNVDDSTIKRIALTSLFKNYTNIKLISLKNNQIETIEAPDSTHTYWTDISFENNQIENVPTKWNLDPNSPKAQYIKF